MGIMHGWRSVEGGTSTRDGSRSGWLLQLVPATARADMHNITYVARVDGLATGSQATFLIAGGQTNMAQLGTVPGKRPFKPTRCLATLVKPAFGFVLSGRIRPMCTARSTWTTMYSPKSISWFAMLPVTPIQ